MNSTARYSIFALACVLLAAPGIAHAVTITEFTAGLSAGAAPANIAPGHDGNVWFVEINNRKIGRVTRQGAITEFPTTNSGGVPTQIARGPGGSMWFSQNFLGLPSLGRIGSTGSIVDHFAGLTAQPIAVTMGPDGHLWFTEQNARIGRISAALNVTEFTTDIAAGAGLTSIAAGRDGNLWFTEFVASRVGRITPGGDVTEFSGGITPASNPSNIVAGPDGNLWFTNRGWISRITTAGVVTELVKPASVTTNARDIAFDRGGNLWWAGGNRIGRMTPAGSIREFSSGMSANANASSITLGPDGNVWYAEFSNDRIGRVRIDPPAVRTAAATGVTSDAAILTGTVNPRSSATSMWFEYGKVGAPISGRTPVVAAGDREGAAAVSARISGLAPETQHYFRIVATNLGGTTVGANVILTTGIDFDRDDDGQTRPTDCDDDDPNVFRGAKDRIQNGVNEDCVGRDAPFPNLTSRISIEYGSARRGRRVVSLRVTRPPARSRIEVRCRGASCPRRRFVRKIARAKRRVELRRRFARSVLRSGVVLEVRVTKRERLGRVRRDRLRPGRVVTKSLCLPPRRVGQREGSIDRSIRPRPERAGEECA